MDLRPTKAKRQNWCQHQIAVVILGTASNPFPGKIFQTPSDKFPTLVFSSSGPIHTGHEHANSNANPFMLLVSSVSRSHLLAFRVARRVASCVLFGWGLNWIRPRDPPLQHPPAPLQRKHGLPVKTQFSAISPGKLTADNKMLFSKASFPFSLFSQYKALREAIHQGSKHHAAHYCTV